MDATDADAAQVVTSLDTMIDEAVRTHPDLRRARHEATAQWEVPSRVGSMPDPVFTVAAQNIRFDEPGLTTSPMSAIQLGLEQALPYPGMLSARSDAAEAMAGVADRQVELLESRIALDVRRAYWRLSFAEASLRISQRSVEVINTLTDAVHIRLSVGKAAAQDALQAQVVHSRLRADIRRRMQVVVSARRALNNAVGRPPGAELPPVASPPEKGQASNRKALLARLRQNNPALAVSRAYVHATATAVDAAEQSRWPDFRVGLVYRFRMASPGDMSEGADMFGVMLGTTLPVWMGSKQNAAVREANARRRAAAEQMSSVDLNTSTDLEVAIDHVERLDEEIALYEREVLPQADAAVGAGIEDYTFARTEFVSLLQSWQAELDVQLILARLKTDRAERLAEIDALVKPRVSGEKR